MPLSSRKGDNRGKGGNFKGGKGDNRGKGGKGGKKGKNGGGK